MEYLQVEKRLFAKVREKYNETYADILEAAKARFLQRGEVSDKETPPHHRTAPEGMTHELTTKATRIRNVQGHENWSGKQALLEKVLEECIDIINYAAMLGAFCKLLLEELKEVKSGARSDRST